MAKQHLIVSALLLLAYFAFTKGTFSDIPDLYSEQENSQQVCTITLNLSDIRIPQIRQSFIRSPNIRELVLQRDGINDIAEGAFKDMENLMILDLSYNQLSSDKLFALGSMENLQALILDYNYAETQTVISVASLEYFYPTLQFLSLRSCRVTQITETWRSNLPTLTHLDLSENTLAIQEVTPYLPGTLTHLYLEKSGITQFCGKELVNLRSLVLDGNFFETITNSEECLEGTLNLNYVESSYLEELSVSDCRITTIDEKAFTQVQNLQVLNVHSNSITTIATSAFQHLTKLQELDLSNNALQQLPNFSTCESLQTLYLNEMHDSSVFEKTDASYWEVKKLKKLSLEGNSLEHINSAMFEKLESLEELNLSRNKLSQVGITWQASQLRKISLSENHITDFSSIDLSGASYVQEIDMKKNSITRFSASALKNFPTNVTIDYAPFCEY